MLAIASQEIPFLLTCIYLASRVICLSYFADYWRSSKYEGTVRSVDKTQ